MSTINKTTDIENNIYYTCILQLFVYYIICNLNIACIFHLRKLVKNMISGSLIEHENIENSI